MLFLKTSTAYPTKIMITAQNLSLIITFKQLLLQSVMVNVLFFFFFFFFFFSRACHFPSFFWTWHPTVASIFCSISPETHPISYSSNVSNYDCCFLTKNPPNEPDEVHQNSEVQTMRQAAQICVASLSYVQEHKHQPTSLNA